MQETFADLVYLTLMDELIPEAHVPGVEILIAEGTPCAKRYNEAFEAYGRLKDRLGLVEDEDLDTLIDSLLDVCQMAGTAMYRYGEKFATEGRPSITE